MQYWIKWGSSSVGFSWSVTCLLKHLGRYCREKVSVLTWHGGKSNVSDINVASYCSTHLGTACAEPEWPELLQETVCAMAEERPTGSQTPACLDFSFWWQEMWGGLSEGGVSPQRVALLARWLGCRQQWWGSKHSVSNFMAEEGWWAVLECNNK